MIFFHLISNHPIIGKENKNVGHVEHIIKVDIVYSSHLNLEKFNYRVFCYNF